MGGDITAESEYGKGSVFTATITQSCKDFTPLGTIAENAYARKENRAAHFIAPDARILIVDDIATNLKVAEGLLAFYKMEIHSCMSGEQAIEMVQAHEYDLVLMDHMMPGMDGIEATARIRALPGERFRSLTIIMLTANAIAGMREMFLSKGLDDYLAKPIEIAKLNELMDKWIPCDKKLKAVPVEQAEESPAFHLKIGGLDTAAGLTATGGTEKGYLKVLELYRRDAAERLKFLRDFAASPDEKSISLFITQVHALKSASTSVGATEISRLAAWLEQAGRSGELTIIREQLGQFCEKLSTMGDSIEAALAQFGSASGQGDLECESLRRILHRLLETLQTEDLDGMDAALQAAQSLPLDKETRGEVFRVTELLLLADFEQAAEIVGALLRMENNVVGAVPHEGEDS
jgi:CheY-like chemotaxis protein